MRCSNAPLGPATCRSAATQLWSSAEGVRVAMRMSGRGMCAISPFMRAGWLVACLLLLLAGWGNNAQAHSGHGHGSATAETKVSAPAGDHAAISVSQETTAAPATAAAPLVMLETMIAAMSVSASGGPFDRMHFGTISTVSGSKSAGQCTCAGACGACSSISCCSAVLAPASYAIIQVSAEPATATPLAYRLLGGSVAPLPRPPNPHLHA